MKSFAGVQGAVLQKSPLVAEGEKMYQKDYWERKELDKRRQVTHPVIVEYVLSKINVLEKIVPFTQQTTLLDVGCGNGFFTYYFDKMCKTVGVDFSEKMVHLNPLKCEQKGIMDASRLGFKDSSFDVVFCHALLHHVEDMDTVIREMARVSGKYVIILEPNRNNPLMFLFSFIVKEERKALKFSPGYLRKVVEKNGLRIIDAFSRGMIVPNKMPSFLVPVVKRLNFKQPFGMTNFIIGEKTTKPRGAGGL
ncbi:MAG: methyltransferase domain-containing protein [Candidatus Aminicenantes bacterium]|nr:methyltransferase domain-containing protein [Candidatus Aminicenantes bacterium]NIM81595.1 methyltransferase domain-containing protein [Candidatus Aminicenantes bacterium]NIN20966.1 methyltransferase domain-containing protein [Candidatus Aminicenantes bacterium]NIN44787.1 methyltransferase domain-containing protein [Candidatus Aminicenantes bacterium]NIN87595.1 methyltransferase domain-containing protein [Candidatus Aminicenantes bacterium]